MILVENVYKRFHGHHGGDWVLQDVSFTIPRGISVGLVGRNGAGKSTLLRLIAAMDAPDRGKIVRNCRVSWPIGLKGGFQKSMTGRQNVKFVARIHGDEAEIDRIVEFVKDFAEIGSSFDQPVGTYSSGMKSRLAFGLSLAFDFDVYLSDEATSVGDASFKVKAKKAFRARVGRAGLIMVSHGEEILRELCQAGIWLENGRAHWYDDVNEAINDYHQSLDLEQSEKGELADQRYQSVRKEYRKLKKELRLLKGEMQEGGSG
jgi:capsular polysaccharide transport system ATP-binding protein